MSSEEVAFLTALKANPADDVARLVYADWLDEHDEPAKAEYLRLVAAITQHEGCLSNAPESPQLLCVSEGFSSEWRNQAGSRFALILDSWTDKIRTIQWIREMTGDGLAEANAASESLPHVLFDSVPFEVALGAYNRGQAVNGIRLLLAAGPLDSQHDGARSALVICARVRNPHIRRTQANTARAALAKVLIAALGLSAEEANELAGLNRGIVLASGLTTQEARNKRALIEQHLPPYEASRTWNIWIIRATVSDTP